MWSRLFWAGPEAGSSRLGCSDLCRSSPLSLSHTDTQQSRTPPKPLGWSLSIWMKR